jgi:hypothetical protein
MKLRNKKTGEIFDLDKMPKWLRESIQICATFYSIECEIYEPAEPLIKDEKIRKAVRAWYLLFDEDKDLSTWEDSRKYVQVDDRAFILLCKDGTLVYELELPFRDKEPSLRRRFELKDYYYTIKELCGEEE